MPVAYATFNHYFVKKRVFMMSLTHIIKGVIITVYPILVNNLMNLYGFRGTLAILAAITSHTIVGMLAMHPIEWHYKLVKIPEFELKPRKSIWSLNRTLFSFNNFKSHRNLVMKKENNGIEVNVNEKNYIERKQNESSAEKREKIEFSMDLKCDTCDLNHTSGWYLKNTTVSIQIIPNLMLIFRQKVIDFFDLTLLKDVVYMNIVIGLTSVLFSDEMLFSLLPIYFKTLGISMVMHFHMEYIFCSPIFLK